MEDKKDLLINKENLSESEKDKLTLDSTKSINVINFINSQVNKAAETNGDHFYKMVCAL